MNYKTQIEKQPCFEHFIQYRNLIKIYILVLLEIEMTTYSEIFTSYGHHDLSWLTLLNNISRQHKH